MAPPVKKCDPKTRCCVPELSRRPFSKRAKQTPPLKNAQDVFSHHTPTIFDTDFSWSKYEQRNMRTLEELRNTPLKKLSFTDLQRLAWAHHRRKADQDPMIQRYREINRALDEYHPGRLYDFDEYYSAIPHEIHEQLPHTVADNPENYNFIQVWDGDQLAMRFLEKPKDDETLRIIRNPLNDTLYVVRQQVDPMRSIACLEPENSVVDLSTENDDGTFSWPFGLDANDALLGGSLFMLGSMTNGNAMPTEATSPRGTSFRGRMNNIAIGSIIFVGLAIASHELGINPQFAPYLEVGAGVGILYGIQRLFARPGRPMWQGMLRNTPYMYLGSIAAGHALGLVPGLEPGKLPHTAATITTSFAGYEAVKYGLRRLPASSLLARAIAASAVKQTGEKVALNFAGRFLLRGITATRVVGTAGLIAWIVDGVLSGGTYLYDRGTGRHNDKAHMINEGFINEEMHLWSDYIVPTAGLRKLAHRGMRKLGIRTPFDDRLEKRWMPIADRANEWARIVDQELLGLTIALVQAANVDQKRIVQKHAGKGFLEPINMQTLQMLLRREFAEPRIKKMIKQGRETIEVVRDAGHGKFLSESAKAIWHATRSDGTIDDAEVLQKHLVRLLNEAVSRQQIQNKFHHGYTQDKHGRLIPHSPWKNQFTKQVKKELSKMRYEYKMARKKLGLTGNTIPKELTKAQREFLYSNDRTITVKVGLHLITLSDVNSKEFYFRKRLAALEHILSILDESAMDKNSLPDFGWHFQQAK